MLGLVTDAFGFFLFALTVCIGSHLARLELRLTTARFFRTFPHARVSTLEGFCDEDMEPAMFFLLTPKKKKCLIEAR